MRSARMVSMTSACWALAVSTSVSMMIELDGMPYDLAVSMMRCAIATRFSAVSGMPSSSRVSPMTTPPYFFAIGKICSIVSCLPFTEFISGRPL